MRPRRMEPPYMTVGFDQLILCRAYNTFSTLKVKVNAKGR